MTEAFRYAKKSNVSDEIQYPYVSANIKVPNCDKSRRNKGKFIVSSYKTLFVQPSKDKLYKPLLERVKIGPAAVALNDTLLIHYKKGIFNHRSCITTINHAAVLIGNDNKGNWILQNYWDKNWGQQGYFRLAKGNTCGVCEYGAMTVTLNKNIGFCKVLFNSFLNKTKTPLSIIINLFFCENNLILEKL